MSKFCVNCKGHTPHYGFQHMCNRPWVERPISKVTGTPIEPKLAFCEGARSSNGECGPDGKHFERKRPEPIFEVIEEPESDVAWLVLGLTLILVFAFGTGVWVGGIIQ